MEMQSILIRWAVVGSALVATAGCVTRKESIETKGHEEQMRMEALAGRATAVRSTDALLEGVEIAVADSAVVRIRKMAVRSGSAGQMQVAAVVHDQEAAEVCQSAESDAAPSGRRRSLTFIGVGLVAGVIVGWRLGSGRRQ